MTSITDELSTAGGIDMRYVVLGVVLALGSVIVAVWAFLNNEITTALTVLLYVLVGKLLFDIGTSPRLDSDPK